MIVDRGTYSAAITLAADVERNTHAAFVGEPIGAPVNHAGDNTAVRLPASGLAVRISVLWWQNSDPRDVRPWIAPDLPAPMSFADYVARRDPSLEVVLAHELSATPAALMGAPNRNWMRLSQRNTDQVWVEWD